METKTETLCTLARQLNLAGIGTAANELLATAAKNQSSYIDFDLNLINAEINHRNRQK